MHLLHNFNNTVLTFCITVYSMYVQHWTSTNSIYFGWVGTIYQREGGGPENPHQELHPLIQHGHSRVLTLFVMRNLSEFCSSVTNALYHAASWVDSMIASEQPRTEQLVHPKSVHHSPNHAPPPPSSLVELGKTPIGANHPAFWLCDYTIRAPSHSLNSSYLPRSLRYVLH